MRTPKSCMTDLDKAFAVAWVKNPDPTFRKVLNLAMAKVQANAMDAKPISKPASQSGFARTDLLSWLLAGTIVFCLSCAWLLDGPSEMQALQDTASNAQQTRQQAQREAQHQARFVKAARRACGGDSAAYLLLADNSIQCVPAGSFRTLKVAL